MHANVLVVENSPSLRWIYVQLFTKLGIPVDCAANGAEALQRIQRTWYRLIVMDVDLPLVNAWETVKEIRILEATGRCKRALITAVTSESQAQTRLHAGMDYYLKKPLSLEDIRCLLKEARINTPYTGQVQSSASAPEAESA